MKKAIVFTIAICLIISLGGCEFDHPEEVKTRGNEGENRA